MSEEYPKLFISYSWSSPEHEQWVIELAERLVSDGVYAILDKWHLDVGQDAIEFMEQMVTNPEIEKVILICDRMYKEKADKRAKGVGTEAQIISPELYKRKDNTKFVAVIKERDEEGNAFVPVFYGGRIFIDLSLVEADAEEYDKLIRWIYDEPVYTMPEIGKKPGYLQRTDGISMGTESGFKRVVDAVRGQKDARIGLLNDYFDSYIEGMERFRISNFPSGEIEDKVLASISAFQPYRDELVSLMISICKYEATDSLQKDIHAFFERVIPYHRPTAKMKGYTDWSFDNYKFIIHELFLHTFACLIKYGRYEMAQYLISTDYYVSERSEGLATYSIFFQYTRSLSSYNQKQDEIKSDYTAYLLKERVSEHLLSFDVIMQADFVLYIKNIFDTINELTTQAWWPSTLIYTMDLGIRFELFTKSNSTRYFGALQKLFGLENKSSFELVFNAISENPSLLPKWRWHSLDVKELLQYDKLATRP